MTTVEQTGEEFAERLFGAALGAVDILAVYLGDRLGWYEALAAGPVDARELAERAGGDVRYAQEWLEQQAATGVLTVGADGRFALPAGPAEVLTDRHSLNYLAPLARMFAGAAVQMPALVRAYRDGGGVGWSDYGADLRESQSDMNRPWFEHRLAPAFAEVAEVDNALSRPGAKVADIGSGGGWSSIALARAYPELMVDGYDIDAPSVIMARENAAELGDRVRFQHADATALPEGAYDLAFAFECVHDMPYPVAVLSAMRKALRPGGAVIVMDEAVEPEFTGPAGEIDRLMYGFSLLVCLPDGMAHPDSAGTGTVMRAAKLGEYAEQAGFTSVRTLPIEDFGFWRFYLLAT
ncbi:SAM-dependent methyltransferase [Nocardia mangyaensis]|uniref:SAM-dependent methyltransferase n=1 Tax=Nocardia mangyaensis TaxID=2213200 RepID=A0A1J0VPP2_9NOCA|nr:methyltransferase domain-containing protein [Nocardia mangyaensis]APE34004.1 SAM-dependent methyltransferase [Nocardia mangyaensis]